MDAKLACTQYRSDRQKCTILPVRYYCIQDPADAKRKRMSKAEKSEKIIEGRVKFETKERAGGSTNTEKKRKKNFAMSKFSFDARKKIGEKTTAKMGRKQERSKLDGGGRDAKKRRRKF